MPKDKLKKTIERVAKILQKKNSTIYNKLKSFVDFLFFLAKVDFADWAFLQCVYDGLAKSKKYLYWSKPIEDDLL